MYLVLLRLSTELRPEKRFTISQATALTQKELLISATHPYLARWWREARKTDSIARLRANQRKYSPVTPYGHVIVRQIVHSLDLVFSEIQRYVLSPK